MGSLLEVKVKRLMTTLYRMRTVRPRRFLFLSSTLVVLSNLSRVLETDPTNHFKKELYSGPLFLTQEIQLLIFIIFIIISYNLFC